MADTLINPNGITQDEMDAIEAIIDKRGMAQVMLALVHITGEKAEHIRSNWGAPLAAGDWDNVSNAMIGKRMSKYLNRLP